MNAAAKALNMSPADYQKQMESYLKMYKMEGQQGITQLLALQKTDPTNAVLYQQMISLLSSKNKVKSEKVNNRNNSVDNSTNLILHKSYQTQCKPGIYHVCEFCDYKTRSKIQFKSHIEIHANVLPIAVLSKKVQTKMVTT